MRVKCDWGIYEIKGDNENYLGEIKDVDREEIADILRGTTPKNKIMNSINENNDYILVDEVKGRSYRFNIK